MSNAPIRIQPVGAYNPLNGINRPAPVPTPAPAPKPVTGTPAGGGFFQDVWTGAKGAVKTDIQDVLHPVTTAKAAWNDITHPAQGLKNLLNPYTSAIKSGHVGQAVGHALGQVAILGGLVLGARALLGLGTAGGPAVGSSSPFSVFFSNLGQMVSNGASTVAHAVGSIISAPFHWIGGLFGGGGASVGF